MKKHLLLLVLLSQQCMSLSAQWLTQSADGKGSFLFKGSNVNFDAISSDFSFTINNMSRPLLDNSLKDNTYLFYGAGLHAKSEEGLSNLFSKGDFVPSGDANGYFGWRFSNSHDAVKAKLENQLSHRLQLLAERQLDEFIGNISATISLAIANSDLDEETDNRLIEHLKIDWNKKLDEGKINKFITFLKTYVATNAGVVGGHGADVQAIITNILAAVDVQVKQNQIRVDRLTSRLIAADRRFLMRPLYRLSVFTFGGIQGTSFKRTDSILTASLSKSFIKEDFRGGNWGLGINYQIASVKIGLTYAYKMTNNFDLLDKTDYKLVTTYTAGNETLTKEKQITAYSGTYGTVEVNELNADIMFNINLSKEDNVYALLDFYLHRTAFSRNKTLLPDNSTVGLGSYFFGKASKFMGGIYVELPDVSNAFEKQKAPADQNIRPALKRLTFGITGKFSLNSLISWQ